ncbi:MAG: hypothetical protein A4S09_05300 [Proteobacteria bacterium SG_bin7]|nr:MAG: hypothetical protein A4S09_05300 [Proteobacteria bacterium SG_bin7]
MKNRFNFIICIISIGLFACTKQGVTVKSETQNPAHYSEGPESLLSDMSPGVLMEGARQKLKLAEVQLTSLENMGKTADSKAAINAYNDILVTLTAASANVSLISSLDTDAKRRDEARDLEQKIDKFANESLGLNTKIYEIVKNIKIKDADSETRFFLEKSLLDFRRSGVDRDEKTRQKIAKLQDELTEQTLKFEKNIADGQKSYEVTDLKELEGLPEDFMNNHKPNSAGKIVITTQYPDITPVFEYATNVDFRKKMYLLFQSRGYPENGEVLKKVMRFRYELAKTLGYRNWAHYVLETKMLNKPEKVRAFIDRMISAADERAKYDYRELLNEKKKIEPNAVEVTDYEAGLYTRKLKLEKVNFDSNVLRQYLPFESVKKGVFEITSKIFGLTYKKVDTVRLWHPEVEAYDVFDGQKYIGRFFLDLFPREGKFSHAAQMTFRTGRKNGAVPQGILMCNFPNPRTQSPALMSHSEFETFLHEFGHLLHNLLAGHHQWQTTSGHYTEWDFIEAPSQFLEEWSKDYDTLASFARHYKTGEVIPRELVEKLNKSERFSQGVFVRKQMFYANMAFELFNKPPADEDLDAIVKLHQNRISMFKYVPDSHFIYTFGHLMGYSATYYTYMWSLVMAKDMFSEFEKKGLYDPVTAKRYREQILEAGATRPAEVSLRAYLRRPLSFEPFIKWLNQKD